MKDITIVNNYVDQDIQLECPDYFMLIVRFKVDDTVIEKARELFLASIPIYWSHKGIIDVRIMESKMNKNTFTVLTNWRSSEDAVSYTNSEKWNIYNEEWTPLLTSEKIKIIETIHDKYELIE